MTTTTTINNLRTAIDMYDREFEVGFRRSVIDSIALGFSSASIVVFVVVLVKF